MEDGISADLHKPFGCTRRPAYSDGLNILEPVEINFFSTFYEVAVGVYTVAFMEKHLAVAALLATYKEYQIVAGGELCNVGQSVGHLAADGVETAEGGGGCDVLLDVIDYLVEFIEAHGGLRVEVDVTREVESFHVVEVFHHDGFLVGLSHETEHFRMTVLSENHDLCFGIAVELSFDSSLQCQHHRAGGVNDFNVVASSRFVGLWWLTVGTQQHGDVMQPGQLLMIDGDESVLVQSLHFHAVVHDVAETVEPLPGSELFFSFFDGSGYAEAETAATIYFYLAIHGLSC
jgi:hypothetical protein